MDCFLQSNDSVSRTNYLRIFALASIDLILTLPFGIVTTVLDIRGQLSDAGHNIPSGWSLPHRNWQPVSMPYATIVAHGTAQVAQLYFLRWSPLALAFAIFALFGVTREARVAYWNVAPTIGRWFGRRQTLRLRETRSSIGAMEFGECPQVMSLDLEIGYVHCLSVYALLTALN